LAKLLGKMLYAFYWKCACPFVTLNGLAHTATRVLQPASKEFRKLKCSSIYRGGSKSFRTGRLEPELQMAELSTTSCSCIVILWVSLVSFAAITLCVASQRVFIFVVYFVIDSVRKLLDTLSYIARLRGKRLEQFS
jgi:hypothetical protein